MGRGHDKSKPRQVSTAAKKSEKATVLEEGELSLNLNRVHFRCRARSRSSQLKQTRLEDHKDKQIMPQSGTASIKTEASCIMVLCSSRQENSAKGHTHKLGSRS